MLEVDRASTMLANEVINKVKSTPFLMITAGLDTVCDSNKSKKFYENSVVEDKSILELDDANHELIKDTEFSSLVIKEAVAWQNMHLF